MNQSNSNVQPEEILKHISTPELHRFILNYGATNPAFIEEFMSTFSPVKVSARKEDYARTILNAFKSNALKSGSRYRQWDNYGFDAVDVAGDLKPLLDKAGYFIKHKNYEEAILICRTLIETIPGEWNPDFDYEGDVQVIYDTAIDKLQEMLQQNLLSTEQKKSLFTWYSAEQKNENHKYIGLNTDLKALEEFFNDSPEMLRQSIKNIDERIDNATSEYDKEIAAMQKIRLLQNSGLNTEAETAINRHIEFSDVRKLRIEEILNKKQYEEAINLIKKGIKIDESKNNPGTVADWKDMLLNIYVLQNDKGKIVSTAEDLFIHGRDSRKYYPILKKYITQSEWLPALQRLLAGMRDGGWSGENEFKAEILIEHQMWESLFALCKKANIESIEKYEKYLRPYYAKEIFNAYLNYTEKQALITGNLAYANVARILKKMKSFEGGKEVVNQLLLKYRELYKRRKNMMEELKDI